MNEKTLLTLGTLGAIVFIGTIIAWFAGGSNLQGNSREILRQMVNFEISIVVICIVLNFIPAVGTNLAAVVAIINILFAVKAFLAAQKGEAFKAPSYELIK